MVLTVKIESDSAHKINVVVKARLWKDRAGT